jgi:hypothetical protein
LQALSTEPLPIGQEAVDLLSGSLTTRPPGKRFQAGNHLLDFALPEQVLLHLNPSLG